jgi:endonuclease YncB( thermonuclease family)
MKSGMSNYARWGRLAVTAVAVGMTAVAVAAESLTGRVVGVHDGDTLTLRIEGQPQIKVRLAGIDAPELKQPYGQVAKQALSALVFDQIVRVEGGQRDFYGRTLGTVYRDEVNVNAVLVAQGAAWVYRAYPHDQTLVPLEAEAQAERRGLWRLEIQHCPPWQYRRKRCP